MNILEEVCSTLDTYSGRDKIMKLLCYSAKLFSGLCTKNSNAAQKFTIFSSKISSARATLRLVDDIPMLRYTIEYGLGKNENDIFMSSLGVVANIVDQLFYPIEKICWLAENKILVLSETSRWETINSIFWAVSIYLNLLRTLRTIALLQKQKYYYTIKGEDFQKLQMKERMEIISILRLSLDLTQAVSTLPSGCLWGGKLQTWHIGFIGSLSAAIGIYQILRKKSLAK